MPFFKIIKTKVSPPSCEYHFESINLNNFLILAYNRPKRGLDGLNQGKYSVFDHKTLVQFVTTVQNNKCYIIDVHKSNDILIW